MSKKLIIAIFVGSALLIASYLSQKVYATGYLVSGQVLNLGRETPNYCPSQGGREGERYLGVNGAQIRMDQVNCRIGYSCVQGRIVTTARGGSYQDGAFYFHDISPGQYELSVNYLPVNLSWYCSIPQEYLYGLHKVRINVGLNNYPGIRFDFKLP